MPAGNGREETKGWTLELLRAIKKSIVFVKAAFLCLAHVLIIVMARVNGDPKYKSYRYGYQLDTPVEELLKASGVDFSNGGGLEELQQFQEYCNGQGWLDTYLGGLHFVCTWMVHEIAVVVESGCTSCLPANRGLERISSLLGFAAGKCLSWWFSRARKPVLAGNSAKLAET